MDSARVVADGGSDIFHADSGGFERGQRFLKLGLVAGEFFNLLLRGPHRCGGGTITFVQQIEGLHGRVVDLFGVGENTLFGFQLLVFAGLQTVLLRSRDSETSKDRLTASDPARPVPDLRCGREFPSTLRMQPRLIEPASGKSIQ